MIRTVIAVVFASLVIVFLAGCKATKSSGCGGCNAGGSTGDRSNASRKVAPLTSLADSIDPLRDYFNENTGRNRFVAILSPT